MAPIARSEYVLVLADTDLAKDPAADWGVARLWDLGDGVAGLQLRTKINKLGRELLEVISLVVECCGRGLDAILTVVPMFHVNA